MRKLRFAIFILLSILLSINLIIKSGQAIATNSLQAPNSYQVAINSPSEYDLLNGSVFYTGSINTVSPAGKQFAQEHALLTKQTIEKIDFLTRRLQRTKALNQEFIDNLGYQTIFWKQVSKFDKSMDGVLLKEIKLFNGVLTYQYEENFRWAIIKSLLQAIYQIEPGKPVNQSLIKSGLYTNLLYSYTDLNDFYQKKYKTLLLEASISHAYEENPNSGISMYDINQVRPLHQKELSIIQNLLEDLSFNQRVLTSISSNCKKLNALYNRIDNYSLAEIDKVIVNLNQQASMLKKKKPLSDKETKILSLINSYITYFKVIKGKLKSNILTYNIEQAIIASQEESKNIKLAYTGIIKADLLYGEEEQSWASSAWNTIKSGASAAVGATASTVKGVVGLGYAAADYATTKAADTYYSYTTKRDFENQMQTNTQNSKNPAAVNNAINNWKNEFDKTDNIVPTATIKNTIVEPALHSMLISNSDGKGLGQAAIVKASQSFNSFDNYVAGQVSQYTGLSQGTSKFITGVGLSVATAGGYGLGKDMTTLNNDKASNFDRGMAAAGVVLNFLPGLATSKSISTGSTQTKNMIETAGVQVTQASDDVVKAGQQVAQAQLQLTNTKGLLAATQAAGRPPEVTLYVQAMTQIKDKGLQNALLNEQNAKNVLENALEQQIAAGANPVSQNVVKGVQQFFTEISPQVYVDRIKNGFTQTISDTIKNAPNIVGDGGIINYIVSSTIDKTVNRGVKEEFTSLVNSWFGNSSNQTISGGGIQLQTGPSTTTRSEHNINLNDPTSMQLLQQYLSGQGNTNTTGITTDELNSTINNVQQNQQNFNDNRGIGNNTNSPVNPNDPGVFNTDPTAINGNSSGPSLNDRVNQMSSQTGGWANQPCPQGGQQSNQGNQPCPQGTQSGNQSNQPCPPVNPPCPTGNGPCP